MIALSMCILLITCRPYSEYDDEFIDGYIIGRESCYQNDSLNYWLIDCTVRPAWQTPQIGDTVVIDTIRYTNVIKIKNLPPDLQLIGLPIAIAYLVIKEKNITGGCNVATPEVYYVREIVPTMLAISGG
jgi:hypothetical protein